MKIKKNDNVIVVTGKDRKKKGKVVRVLPKEGKVIVEGINMTKRHERSKAKGKSGQVVTFAAPIDVSNVMIEDPKTKEPTRIGTKFVNGEKIRIAKKSGAELK